MRSVLHLLGPDCASCVERESVTSSSNSDHLVAPQPGKFRSVDFIFHVQNLLMVCWEKAENNRFAGISGSLGNSHFLCKPWTT